MKKKMDMIKKHTLMLSRKKLKTKVSINSYDNGKHVYVYVYVFFILIWRVIALYKNIQSN